MELLVYMAILSIVMVLLAGIFREGTLSSGHTIEDSTLDLSLRSKADVLREDIRSSKIGSVNSVGYPNFNASSNTLTLFTGMATSPATLQYYLSGNTLYRKVGGGSASSFLTDVSAFTVVVNESTVEITIQVNKISSDYSKRQYQKSITLKVKPRASIS